MTLLCALPAQAGERTFSPSAQDRRTLVFEVRGLNPDTITAARLRAGGRTRRLRVGAVRAGVARGVLRVRTPVSWGRRARSAAVARRRRPKLVVTVDTEAPTAPTSVVATAGAESVALSWAPSTDNVAVAGYRIYRLAPDGTWPASPLAASQGRSFIDTLVAAGTTYAYRVTAYDAAGNESATSAAASATPTASSPTDGSDPGAPDPTGLQPLTVSGNQILRGGRPFRFYGVNRDTLEWGRSNWGGCGGDGHFMDADFDRIAAWHVTAVRFPLSQAGWLGRRCDRAAYARALDDAIARANARGMYAIVDLHWSDVGGLAPCDSGCATGQQPMPDADSLVFWREVAQRYANWPGVIFNLHNEPHDVSWSCWRDGGCPVLSSGVTGNGNRVTYTAVGMQQLYDAVRAQGAGNLVLVAGLDWAYDLSGVLAGYALTGTNIAYDTHVYTRWHNIVADWDAHFGRVASHHPVISTEFGSTDCSSTATAALLDYFRAPAGNPDARMSWTIWSWNAPGSCSQPSVIADWNGTPLAGQGQLIHDALAALAP